MVDKSTPENKLTTDKKFIAFSGTGTLKTIAAVFKFKPETLKQ